jgi:NAD(P)-dependent dehydrogenase (short-subunit alcohol dehydrogenase family)
LSRGHLQAVAAGGVFLGMKYKNAFPPGVMDTPMLPRAAESFGMTYEEIAQCYPIKRIVRAEEMAAVVTWLSSQESGAVMGSNLDASGGCLTG